LRSLDSQGIASGETEPTLASNVGFWEDVRSSFRRLDPADYPEVTSCSREEAYGNGDNMAPGGLYLAARMTRSMNLMEGDIVLDIGCGRGDSSVFLARRFGVTVVCFDLWISSTFLSRKAVKAGCRNMVLPLDLDASNELPFPDDYFDMLFCMQSLHTFGASPNVLRQLIRHLKPGGRFAVGGTCFNEEPLEGELPRIYERTDDWAAEYSNYHSPPWWKAAFEATRLAEVTECFELTEGLIMWEDEVLSSGDRARWSEVWCRRAKWLVDQLIYSRSHRPYLTHYILNAQKKGGRGSLNDR